MKTSYLAAAVLAVGASSAMADGEWDCADLTFSGGLSAVSCAGSFSPPPLNSLADFNAESGVTYLFWSKDDDNTAATTSSIVNGVVGSSNGDSSFTILTALSGNWGLEVKLGQEWSVFNFTGGVAAGTYTMSLGPAYADEKGLGLSHVSVAYDNTLIPGPIPEPSTYALMLAGLAAVGMVARRRSRK